MVRAALLLSASGVSALEPTGLLQATVGMHSQLSTGSDKVASLKRMEKEWQAAAKKGTRVDDSVLQTVYDSMEDILNDTVAVKAEIEAALAATQSIIANATTVMQSEHNTLISGFSTGQWGEVCNQCNNHASCRGGEKMDCDDRDDECKDMDDCRDHCVADDPLCACKAGSASYGDMKTCLEKALAWYNNYHTEEFDNGRGYALGDLGASETRANLTKEEAECPAATTVCNNKKAECDAAQVDCQTNFCSFNTMCDQWCSKYQTDYATAVTTYNEQCATFLTDDGSMMLRNLDVCYAAKKVICFINVIANKGYKSSDTASDRGTTYELDGANLGAAYDYDYCLNYDPECTDLELTAPPADPPQDCNDYQCTQTCSANGLPESTSWMNAYYKTDNTQACQRNIDFYLSSQPETLGASC